MNKSKAKDIYTSKVSEVLSRLDACESFLETYKSTHSVFVAEAAILQLRKALECVAYASIAPNQKAYAEYRAKADRQNDFTKDYHARQILSMLRRINPKFFPQPISSPISQGPNKWHFEKRQDDSLNEKRFKSIYDRLGKFLHADNPWGNEKNQHNFLNDTPDIIKSIRLLLSWHYTEIITPKFTGVWVVKVPTNGENPEVIEAIQE